MNKKIFNPEDYDMVICPCCDSHGYIQNPEHQCCPKCGGFGFVKKEAKENRNISASNPLSAKHILDEG
jgi:RecJ-like exonuclease